MALVLDTVRFILLSMQAPRSTPDVLRYFLSRRLGKL